MAKVIVEILLADENEVTWTRESGIEGIRGSIPTVGGIEILSPAKIVDALIQLDPEDLADVVHNLFNRWWRQRELGE